MGGWGAADNEQFMNSIMSILSGSQQVDNKGACLQSASTCGGFSASIAQMRPKVKCRKRCCQKAPGKRKPSRKARPAIRRRVQTSQHSTVLCLCTDISSEPLSHCGQCVSFLLYGALQVLMAVQLGKHAGPGKSEGRPKTSSSMADDLSGSDFGGFSSDESESSCKFSLAEPSRGDPGKKRSRYVVWQPARPLVTCILSLSVC